MPFVSRFRSIAGKLLLSLASIVVTLAVAECTARLMWSEAVPPQSGKQLSPRQDLPVLHTITELNQVNVRGIWAGVYYESNSVGFRGREYSLEKPPGVFRIAVIGDSFTMGSGVLAEEAYPAVVERRLNARSGSTRYEVLNLGMSGFDTYESVERLKHMGLRFDPDLIVYGWSVNDLEGAGYEAIRGKQNMRFVAATAKDDRSPFHLVRLLKPRWLSLQDLIAPPENSYLHELDYNYFENPAAWRRFLASLDELARVGRKQDACTVVLLHTSLFYLHRFHPFKRYYDAVTEASLERGMYVVPTLPAFKGHDAPTLWIGRNDSHPNPKGHAILAESLVRGLEGLPADCMQGEAPPPAPAAPAR